MGTEALLRVDGLEVAFPAAGGGWESRLHGVSLSAKSGERIGLVGASGSGKSLTALAILGLVQEPGKIRAGRVLVEGVEASDVDGFRGGVVGLVLQEAGSALNPTYSVGYQLVETIEAHGTVGEGSARRRAIDLLDEVALEDSEDLVDAYPHQLSGGQAQRVMIALALAGNPRVIIADEPTTALDVITQAKIIELLVRITDQRDLALLLVSHDLAVLAGLVHRVVVLEQGRVVEEGPADEVLSNPKHPETSRLVAAARTLRGHRGPT